MKQLHISILGAGNIAEVLGQKWIQVGHTVTFGVRNPASESARHLREKLGDQVLIASPELALVESEVVLLAVTGSAVEEVIATNAALLDNKIIIDATNQVAKGKSEATKQWQGRGVLNSLELVQRYAPQAQYYRAFNSYSWEIFANPVLQGTQADLFYCGTTGDARSLVEQLIGEIGLYPVNLGGLDKVGVVDEVLQLWATLALFQGLGRDNVAFKVLTRER